VLLLNLGAAYCEKQDYDKAKEILLQVNPRRLTGMNRSIYWADFAYVCFYLNENEQANAILTQQKAAFSKLGEDPQVGALIQILLIFQMLSQGNQSGAQILLEQVRPQWENEHTAPDFTYLENQINKSFP
jgi:predicted negative regulator of RcsB-dependent stress response